MSLYLNRALQAVADCLSPQRLRPALLGAVAATALLASCGGGGSTVDGFDAKRLLTFGDELSIVQDDGHTWVPTYVTDDGEEDCDAYPTWVQLLASNQGLVFGGCNPDARDVTAYSLATEGATVADFEAQVDDFEATDTISSRDLVTVMVGLHDILEAYSRYPATSAGDLVDELKARGDELGQAINRLTETGAPVIVSTIYNLGLTPYAHAENEATGEDRANVLERLTTAFNDGMRLAILNDGSKIGLVLADDIVGALENYPGSYSIDDTENAVCLVAPPNCTTDTLVEDGSVSDYLWADDLHPSRTAHRYIGNSAINRVDNNPF